MQHKLWQALDILREMGWTKGQMEDSSAQHCMAGAIMAAHGLDMHDSLWIFLPESQILTKVIDEYHPGLSVAGFNDHEDTTWPMVSHMMEKAAIRGDELVDQPTPSNRNSLGERL